MVHQSSRADRAAEGESTGGKSARANPTPPEWHLGRAENGDERTQSCQNGSQYKGWSGKIVTNEANATPLGCGIGANEANATPGQDQTARTKPTRRRARNRRERSHGAVPPARDRR